MQTDLAAPGQNQRVLIPGPAGDIECIQATPVSDIRGVCLICHPHPLYGGAMTNKVTYMLASSALHCGLVAMRFNFRGVGETQGSHDHGQGETEDTLVLAQWLRHRLPDLPLVLAGFSFGGFVSLQAAAGAHPDLQISIAPPFKYFDGRQKPPHPGCPWLVVHGRDDDVVAYAETVDALQDYQPPAELVSFDGVGHFFHGRLQDLRAAVIEFIDRQLPG